MKQKRTIMVC
jgi:hypothetical protein